MADSPASEPTKLKITQTGSDEGKIIIRLKDDSDHTYQVSLSIFDLSLLVSALYEARAEAMSQPNAATPEVMLPIADMVFGEDGKGEWQLLRIYSTQHHFQDFGAKSDSQTGRALKEFGQAMATLTGVQPVPWGDPSAQSH